MSYISTRILHGDVLVWERDSSGIRSTKTFEAPHYFYVDDPNGDYRTIFDTPVSKVTFPNSREAWQAKQQYSEDKVKMWESDIGPELRVLSNNYFNVAPPKLHITHLDIEVDYDPIRGFSSPKDPYAPINAIALYHEHRNEMIAMAVPPEGQDWNNDTLARACNEILPVPEDEYTVRFMVCQDEEELLLCFLDEIEDSDLLCGWNAERFDFPYLGGRIRMILGEHHFARLSFLEGNLPVLQEQEIGKKKFDDGEDSSDIIRETQMVLTTSGRLLADYMLLYKKYEAAEKPSYKLSSVSEDVLVDDDTDEPLLPKLEYEGSLADLYRKDFAFFVRYNIRDTEILHGFEKKLGYISLANTLYHLSTGQFVHVLGTLKLAELAIVNYCHHTIKRVVPNVTRPDIDRAIEGALVLLPQVGMHELLGSIDINSLYPTAIRSLNMSPEKIRGQFIEEIQACIEICKGSDVELTLVWEKTKEHITATADEWRTYLWDHKMAVSGYGTVFLQDSPGIIPSVLGDWFAQRKKYQALKKEAAARHDYEAENYYDRLQYVYKIKLNSLYGALSNLYFRFYDLRLGESTTGTGRMILKHQCRKVNEVLDGNYNVDFPLYRDIEELEEEDDLDEESEVRRHSPDIALNGPVFNGQFQSEVVIYGDTDSTYFKTFADNIEDAILIADEVAAQVNASYQDFMIKTFLCQPGFDNLVKCGREVVADRGIFVEKKRYILHLVDVEGKRVDKCKVMGLDTKKTTLPVPVSKKLNGFIERLLKGETWDEISQSVVDYKDELINSKDIMDIGLPKGVKKVEQYTEDFKRNRKCRLPGHVAGSIFYNQCLIEYDDKVSMQITSGMKIKVFRLKGHHGRFKCIAIPTDAEFVPTWFMENFMIDKPSHIERLVDKPLTNILKAIDEKPPTQDMLTFKSAWEF